MVFNMKSWLFPLCVAHFFYDYALILWTLLSPPSVLFYCFIKKTPSIRHKILHIRVLYINPRRDTIVPSYVDAH